MATVLTFLWLCSVSTHASLVLLNYLPANWKNGNIQPNGPGQLVTLTLDAHPITDQNFNKFRVQRDGFCMLKVGQISESMRNLLSEMEHLDPAAPFNVEKDRRWNGWFPSMQRGAKEVITSLLRGKTAGYYNDGNHARLEFDTVVALDAVVRDTNPVVGERFKALQMVHIDWQPQSLLDLIDWFGDQWVWSLLSDDFFFNKAAKYFGLEPYVEAKKLRSHLWEDFDGKQEFWSHWKLVEQLSVWTALNQDGVKADPLVMMKRNSYNSEREIGKLISPRTHRDAVDPEFPRKPTFPGLALKRGKASHEWWIRTNMQFGEAYVFQTTRTPHSAARMVDQSKHAFRKSCDTRLLVLKWNSELS